MNTIFEDNEQEMEIEALNHILIEKNYEILEYQKLLQEKQQEIDYLIMMLKMNNINI
jgi:hypothetical protein